MVEGITHRAFMIMKARLLAARKGYELLKKRSDAIKNQLQGILKKILEAKRTMGETMRKAFHAHTDAVWAAGEFK